MCAPPPERIRALAAYREALRLDRSVAARDPALIPSLRTMFGDAHQGEGAIALAEDLGPAAREALQAFADETRDPRLRRRALAALEKVDAARR
jgi:hypothetical protein